MADTDTATESNIYIAFDSESIRLDPSVLQGKKETYSSLTDTNGVDLFTDGYEEQVKNVHSEEEKQNKQVEKALFYSARDTKKNEYEKVQSQLFLNTQTQVRKEAVVEKESHTGLIASTIGIIVIIFFLILFSFLEKHRKRRRADAINTYHYE